MKPKTKLQVRIMNLSESLPAVSDIQKEWSNNNHKKYFVRHYKNFICLECNHKWNSHLPEWSDKIVETHCPNCNNKIELIKENKPRFYEWHIFSIITTIEEFQVIRYFTTWKNMSKTNIPSYNTVELYQEWDTDFIKKTIIVGLNRSGSYYTDGFQYGSNFDIKIGYNPWGSYCYNTTPDFVYPEFSVLPIIRRNGFDNEFYNCSPRRLFQNCLTSNIFETLLKIKNRELIIAKLNQGSKVERFWKQILICLKHNYFFDDFSLWFDYVELLEYFNIDVNNPKFICPEDLKKVHNQYMNKKRLKEQRLEIQRERRRAVEDQKKREMEAIALKLKKKHFKDFVIKNGQMKIVVLLSSKDFKREGEILQHCVYENNYHKRKDSLIMSARINDQPIETIEISLSKLEIIQIRGFDNEPTQYHNDILQLVKKNLPKIGQIIKKHQKEVSNQKAA